jgi:hypothetical protein
MLRQRDAAPAGPATLSARRIAAAGHDAPAALRGLLPRAREPRLARHPRLPAGVFSPLDVIVDAREAAAWRQLLAGVRSGNVDLSRLARSNPWLVVTEEEEVLLPMVVIEPLPADPREQGVHQ